MILREYFKKAKIEKFAIPHFNFSNFEIVKAIVLASREAKTPVLIGVSEKEEEYLGVKTALNLVCSLKDELGAIVFINADHHKSFESCKRCIDLGFDSVHFDGSALPFEENIKITRQVVDYKNRVNPTIMIEGELGYIVGSSKVLEEKIELKDEFFTNPSQAKQFLETTGIDRLAISVGNIHGISVFGNPKLRFDLIKAINEVVAGTNLVLHGGSGISDDDFRKAIDLGITNIHLNTELRQAWRENLQMVLKENPAEMVPYIIGEPIVENIKKFLISKIKVFRANNKI